MRKLLSLRPKPYSPATARAALRLAGQRMRARQQAQTISPPPSDIIDWAQSRFYVPSTAAPIVLAPHQVAVTRLALTRNPSTGYMPFRTIIFSAIKKSGKSTWAGMVARWYAETGHRHSEIYAIGNDLDQAKERSFREVRLSLELTPGYDPNRDRIPGQWNLMKESMTCLRTGSVIRALAVDARGEAGGKPAVQVITELWGAKYDEERRFWEEMTPVPTIPDSFRIVETYAGFVGESELLYSLYETGKDGRQLSAGELARLTDTPLGSFAESPHPDDPVPLWVNERASMLMYWDTGLAARRMPWQVDERGEAYYIEQEESLPTPGFRRMHMNEWSSSESAFIPPEVWDGCLDLSVPSIEGDAKTPLVIGIDAGTTLDAFAVVAVSRHPQRHEDVAVRALRVFDPKEQGHPVDYAEAEAFIRAVCAQHNVIQIAYDPYQLESMTQRLRADGVAWCEPFSQAGDRLRADRGLYDLIISKRITHNGDQRLREHILNASAKVQKDMDSTLRLVKASPRRSIDAAVALSMASSRCLYLLL